MPRILLYRSRYDQLIILTNFLGYTPHLLPSLKRCGRYGIHAFTSIEILTQLKAGVTHVFANLGSDHPSILEAMVKGQKEKKDQFPTIVTCPNEVSRYFSPDYSRPDFNPAFSLLGRWLRSQWPMVMLACPENRNA